MLPVQQRRNEVRCRPGQETTLAPPVFNLRFYGSNFTVLKEVFVTLLEIFGAPIMISVPGELLPPCTRSLRP